MVSFVILGDINDISGGHIYNRKIAEFSNIINIIYCNTLEALKASINKQHDCLLIDAWALHDIELQNVQQPFHLLAHHPIALDQTVKGDETKEINLWNAATSIITTSEYVRDYIKGLSNTPVFCINPGVDPYESTRDYPIFPKKINGYGSVIERKGDLLLIEALSKIEKLTINRFGPHTDLEFYCKVTLAAKKLKSSKIIFNGLLSDYDKKVSIKSTDLAVFPTFYESYGMAIQECLNAKIPVLTSDTVGMRLRFGDQGIRYIKQDATSWAEALEAYCLQSHNYQTLVQEVKNIQCDFNTWKEQSNKLQTILNY